MERRIHLTVLLLFTLWNVAFCQQARDVFNPQATVAWLGIDFSSARFIGDYEEFNSTDDVTNLMQSLNDLMAAEPEKYDVGKMMGKPKVHQKLDVTTEHNKSLDVGALMADSLESHVHMKAQDIQNIIGHYDFKENTGIGLMLNVESFNKKIKEGLIWVTFINMGTKEVLFTERLVEKPTGFGIRNYWAGSIYRLMNNVRKREFKNWQLRYGSK